MMQLFAIPTDEHKSFIAVRYLKKIGMLPRKKHTHTSSYVMSIDWISEQELLYKNRFYYYQAIENFSQLACHDFVESPRNQVWYTLSLRTLRRVHTAVAPPPSLFLYYYHLWQLNWWNLLKHFTCNVISPCVTAKISLTMYIVHLALRFSPEVKKNGLRFANLLIRLASQRSDLLLLLLLR